tara:strand:+ start:2612 stop:3496 length:885 start_codon:yes stop_codon:yes gene_type:complete
MKTISRNDLIAENLIRTHVRKRIKNNLKKTRIAESKIRKAIRRILEAETGTEEASQYTGINVLADLLKKIIPTIEDDYKMLTTSVEQRESFRNHIIHAIKNSLRPLEAIEQGEEQLTKKLPEHFDLDVEYLLEKMKIDLTPEEESTESVEGEFIDIEDDTEDDFVNFDDQNETGRNFAAESFKSVEKQIVDAYDMLADDEDQNLFYDYLVTNMLLYFDKFEDELAGSLPDTTTPEYEEEKAEKEAEEASAETSETEAEEVATDDATAPAEEPAAEEPEADAAAATGMPPGMDDD